MSIATHQDWLCALGQPLFPSLGCSVCLHMWPWPLQLLHSCPDPVARHHVVSSAHGIRRPCFGPWAMWWLLPGPQCVLLTWGSQQFVGILPRAPVCVYVCVYVCVCTCMFLHVCPYLTCKNTPCSVPQTCCTFHPQPPIIAITFPLPGVLEPARPCQWGGRPSGACL